MAQAFITVYNSTYRQHEIDRRKIMLPIDKFAETLPEGDMWLIKKSLEEESSEGTGGLDEANKSIKKMYLKRYWTIYQTEYCNDMIPKEEFVGGSFENALLEYCKQLYGPKTYKIPPPRPSARKVFGYLRPGRMYFPVTTIQDHYGKLGYKILKGDFAGTPSTGGGKKESAIKGAIGTASSSSAEAVKVSKGKAKKGTDTSMDSSCLCHCKKI